MNDYLKIVKALSDVTDYASRNVCLHSSTHRGGAIWEICDECGAQWADDRNPKQDHEHEYPKEIQNAYEALNEIAEAPLEPKQRTREEEIEAFERLMSDGYKNMEKIEKQGINYMHSRTNSALWIWLERAKLDSNQFDGLMVGMLAENDMLKKALAGCRHAACYSVGESEALADQLRKVREIASRALES